MSTPYPHIPDKTGRLASYRITEPGLARLVIETGDVYDTIVNVPADVLLDIATKANRPAGVAPDGHMVCLVCGHPVIRSTQGALFHADHMTRAYEHPAVIEQMGDTETPLLPYSLSPEGHVGGVSYVTVLDAGGNPIEYEIPREDAVARYSAELDC